LFRVITVEREFGSGAADIARALASRLGWKLWDKDLTEEIAREANVDRSAVARCEERIASSSAWALSISSEKALTPFTYSSTLSCRRRFGGCA
jgi:hypothetical protein